MWICAWRRRTVHVDADNCDPFCTLCVCSSFCDDDESAVYLPRRIIHDAHPYIHKCCNLNYQLTREPSSRQTLSTHTQFAHTHIYRNAGCVLCFEARVKSARPYFCSSAILQWASQQKFDVGEFCWHWSILYLHPHLAMYKAARLFAFWVYALDWHTDCWQLGAFANWTVTVWKCASCTLEVPMQI